MEIDLSRYYVEEESHGDGIPCHLKNRAVLSMHLALMQRVAPPVCRGGRGKQEFTNRRCDLDVRIVV